MEAPQYVMLALLLWEGITGFYRMNKDGKVVSSVFAAFCRVATITAVLAWGGFWSP